MNGSWARSIDNTQIGVELVDHFPVISERRQLKNNTRMSQSTEFHFESCFS